MSGLPAGFHFLQPWWLLALLFVPVLLWWLRRQMRADHQLAHVVDPDLLPFLMTREHPSGSLSPWLAASAWVLACLALAGPAWQRLPTPVAQGPEARVIVVSLADTMLATDLKPDRLSRARFKIRDLLRLGRDGQNALVAYAGEAFVVAPLTTDVETVDNFLADLEPGIMPVAGDAAGRGIDKAVDLLQQAGIDGGDVILVADHADDTAVAAARRALAAGVQVSVLGVATSQGTPVALPGGGFLQDAAGNIVIPRLGLTGLQAVATAGGGRYRTLSVDESDVQALVAASRHASAPQVDARSVERVERWRDEGPWLLLLLLPLAALGFRRGWLMLFAATVLLPMAPAQAGQASGDPWRNADQQAVRALQAGQPQEAQRRARSPALRGAAAYRAGDYAAAAEAFAKSPDGQSQYNLGNALARQGKFSEAVEAWNRALAQDPSLTDAQANREVVEEWLKQQPKLPPQPGDGEAAPSSDPDQQHSPSPQRNPDPESGQDQEDGSQPAPPSSAGGSPQADATQQPSGDEHPTESGQAEEQSSPSGQSSAPAPSTQQAGAGSSSTDRDVDGAPPALDSVQVQEQEVQSKAAQQALGKALDQQLQQTPAPVHHLGQSDQVDGKPLPPSVRQTLDRVPENPGKLLKRKFMLEYQQQQQGGGT